MASIDQPSLAPERLRPYSADDLLPLSVEAGWNQVADDWRFMLSRGNGVGIRHADRWIACALVLPLGLRVAWISMVLVTAEHRRQGIAAALLEQCFETVGAGGRAAGLDATELGRPVYLRHGFRDLYRLRRWRLDGPLQHIPDCPRDIHLRPLRSDDRSRLVAFDRARSGLDRGPILQHLARRKPELATIAETRSGALAGYVLARDGRIATHVGPVVADRDDIAIALLAAAMRPGVGSHIVDVPDRHERVVAWLTTNGATAPRAFVRMINGDAAGLDDPGRCFALAGPELA